jgi:peroxiredoxin
MALVESLKLEIGTTMPDFTLNTPDNNRVNAYESTGNKGLLILFTCNHCPYAIAIWPRMIELSKQAKQMGINTLAVNPNINPNYPDDSPENMVNKIVEWNIPFPYLVDTDQSIATQYQAQCTPDIYLLNSQHNLVYHGRLDDNWQNEKAVTTHDLKDAITNLSEGSPISGTQFPTMGCSIKWMP